MHEERHTSCQLTSDKTCVFSHITIRCTQYIIFPIFVAYNTQMAPFINIHTHRRASTNDIQVLVLNPEEWQNNSYSEKELYTVGIHPWHSNDNNITEQLEWLEKALRLKNVIAIGEVGLDRSTDIPLTTQEAVLKPQLELAKNYSRPLVFHAVKSIANILHTYKQEKVQQPFIVHGFTGKPEAVQQIYKSGGYASFGAKLIENRSWDEALKEAYRLKNLLFETDEANTSIDDVYLKAAEILGVELNGLKEQVDACFRNIFGEAVKSIYATE